ncbi:patatin-like phospholipase family protein [Clostridioides difficile]|uniref:patatin-like phospholipase family protein n=1 Tax=Clostridioides difficile TaxID=1496 RepID=UPI0020B35D59|nr:patatin-like phospholipase family protein [Clostridioides difficile]
MLAFDGGGLKGALSISILERIVKEYPNLLNNINMFGGTSTGSLIALGLAYGVSPKEIKELYSIENSKYIFNKSYAEILRPKYENKNLKEVLLSIFPEELELKDLNKLVMIPSFYIGNEENAWKPVFYNNMPNSFTKTSKVVDVAMASSAAPVFFPTYNRHVDGGIIATDPSLACIIHAIDSGFKLKNTRLFSIGTGYVYNSIKADTTEWGAIDWIINKEPDLPIISITLEGNSQMSQLFSQKLLGDNYYRLNPKMEKDVAMDDCDALEYLMSLGENCDIKDAFGWIKKKSFYRN